MTAVIATSPAAQSARRTRSGGVAALALWLAAASVCVRFASGDLPVFCDALQGGLVRDLRHVQLSSCRCSASKDNSSAAMVCANLSLTSVPCADSTGGAAPTASTKEATANFSVLVSFRDNAISQIPGACLASYAGRIGGNREQLKLDFSKNRIALLSDISFLGLHEHLVHLDLSENLLRKLDKNLFVGFARSVHLHLDLSANLLSDVCDMQRLQTVKDVRLDRNNIGNLAAGCLKFPDAKSLNLSGNMIYTIEKNAFADGGKNIEFLSLSNNRLGAAAVPGRRRFEWLEQMSALQTLDLSGNEISDMDELCEVEISALRVLDLRGNRIRSLGPRCRDQSRITDTTTGLGRLNLHLDGNGLNKFLAQQLPRWQARLGALTLTSNGLREADLRGFRALELLDVSNNSLDNFSFLCAHPLPALRYLSAARNRFRSLTELKAPECRRVMELGRLTKLNLSGNGLTEVEESAFFFAPNLEELDLSRNGIGHLRGRAFASFRSLRRLWLTGNALSYINPCSLVGPSPNLTAAITDSALLSLRYDENPLHCGCDSAPLQELAARLRLRSGMAVSDAHCASPSSIAGRWAPYANLDACPPVDGSPSGAQRVCDDLTVNVRLEGSVINGSWTTAKANATVSVNLYSLDSSEKPAPPFLPGHGVTSFRQEVAKQGDTFMLCVTVADVLSFQRDCSVHPTRESYSLTPTEGPAVAATTGVQPVAAGLSIALAAFAVVVGLALVAFCNSRRNLAKAYKPNNAAPRVVPLTGAAPSASRQSPVPATARGSSIPCDNMTAHQPNAVNVPTRISGASPERRSGGTIEVGRPTPLIMQPPAIQQQASPGHHRGYLNQVLQFNRAFQEHEV